MEASRSLSLEDVLVALKSQGTVRGTRSRTSSFSGGAEASTSALAASDSADVSAHSRAALLQMLNSKLAQLDSQVTFDPESHSTLLQHLPGLASAAPDAASGVLAHLTASLRRMPDSTRGRAALPVLLDVAWSAATQAIASHQASQRAQHWNRLAASALKVCVTVILGGEAEFARPAPKQQAASSSSSSTPSASHHNLKQTASIDHSAPRSTSAAYRSAAPLEAPLLVRLLDVSLLSLSVGVARSTHAAPSLCSSSSRTGLRGGALGAFGGASHSRSGSRTRAWLGGSSPGSNGASASAATSQLPTLKGKGSNASLSSLASSQSESSNWRFRPKDAGPAQVWSQSEEEETEAEAQGSADGEADARKLTDAQRSLRLAALSLISALCSAHSTALLPHWNRLLLDAPTPSLPPSTSSLPSRSIPQPPSSPSTSLLHALETDPSIAVRASCARALEALLVGAETSGFLAAAQERSARLEKYTSLSARIAGALVELRERVVVVLGAYAKVDANKTAAKGRAHVLGAEALLKLARTLVQTTSKAKLRVSHMALLRSPALSLCSSSEPTLAVCAYALLGALLASPTPALAATGQPDMSALQDGGREMVDALLRHLSEEVTESEVRAQAWTALAALIAKQWQAAEPHEEAIIALLLPSFQTSNSTTPQRALILEAVTSALVALLRSRATSGTAAPAYYAALSPAFQVSLATARAQLADALPAWSTLYRGAAQRDGMADPREVMKAFAGDAEGTVRANAARALGAMLALEAAAYAAAQPGSEEATSETAHAWTLQAAVELLLESSASSQGLLQDTSPLVRMRASWALANASDALFASASHRGDHSLWERCARAALLASRDEERIALHALRALGSLLSSVSAPDGSSTSASEAISALCAALEGKRPSPKLSWNAAAALERALCNAAVRALLPPSLAGRVSVALASALGLKTFKTKLSAARALLCHASAAEYGGAEARESLRAHVERACGRIEDEVREATFGEAQLHGKPCVEALHELKRHLDELGV